MYGKVIKPILDKVMALTLIVAFSIPMVLIFISVKMSSKGPAVFKQKRFGKDTTQFVLYKFRTMTYEAPILANREFDNLNTYLTPLGKILRESSLDELPQLFNILLGHMSFIGPRPLAETDKTVIDLRQKSGADRVLPGITGLAQVNGRNQISDENKAELDSQYADSVSFVLDMQIIILTLTKVFRKEGIYKER